MFISPASMLAKRIGMSKGISPVGGKASFRKGVSSSTNGAGYDSTGRQTGIVHKDGTGTVLASYVCRSEFWSQFLPNSTGMDSDVVEGRFPNC
jgi:hypothetical protein